MGIDFNGGFRRKNERTPKAFTFRALWLIVYSSFWFRRRASIVQYQFYAVFVDIHLIDKQVYHHFRLLLYGFLEVIRDGFLVQDDLL